MEKGLQGFGVHGRYDLDWNGREWDRIGWDGMGIGWNTFMDEMWGRSGVCRSFFFLFLFLFVVIFSYSLPLSGCLGVVFCINMAMAVAVARKTAGADYEDEREYEHGSWANGTWDMEHGMAGKQERRQYQNVLKNNLPLPLYPS